MKDIDALAAMPGTKPYFLSERLIPKAVGSGLFARHAVFASAAKQSRGHKRLLDCFAALAMTAKQFKESPSCAFGISGTDAAIFGFVVSASPAIYDSLIALLPRGRGNLMPYEPRMVGANFPGGGRGGRL